MASSSQKLSDPEAGLPPTDQETAFNETGDENTKFITPSQPNGEVPTEKRSHDDFQGLTREELERYATDPKWMKVRLVLFIIFVICWVLMLIAAIVIVVVTPKCPPVPALKWYETGAMYKLNVEKFQDSDADGVGDLKGVQERLDHFTDLQVKTLWFTAGFLSRDDLSQPQHGTKEDFKMLAKTLKKKGIRTVIDLDLTAVSTNNDIYKKSKQGGGSEDFTATPDTNGVAELNLNNTALQTRLEGVFRSWVEAGAEGFVLMIPDNAKEVFNSLADKFQTILNDEYNKLDDRDRVIIAPSGQMQASTSAIIVQPAANCSDVTKIQCSEREIESLRFVSGKGEGAWRILQLTSTGVAVIDLAQKLTVPGTPNLIYGDEIGLTGGVEERGYMSWDDTNNRGFSSAPADQLKAAMNADSSSVLAQKSVGYTDVSYYKLFRRLVALRADEPSLKWGSISAHEFADEALVFLRQAEGFPPVAVAMNPSDSGKSGRLVSGDHTMGEILAVSGVDLAVGDKVDMSAVYLPSKAVLIARLYEPEKSDK